MAGRWRHKVRGTEYEVLGTATLQTATPLCDEAELTLYQGDDGRIWARPPAEFAERFEAVASLDYIVLATAAPPNPPTMTPKQLLKRFKAAVDLALDSDSPTLDAFGKDTAAAIRAGMSVADVRAQTQLAIEYLNRQRKKKKRK